MSLSTCRCARCGVPFSLHDLTFFDEDPLCEDCLDNETIVCQDCENRVRREDNAGSDEHPLCERCYEHHYTRCTSCGMLLYSDDAQYAYDDPNNSYPYCEACCPRCTDEIIHDYSFKPIPIFYGSGPRFFGVELEIDEGGESQDNAAQIMKIGNVSNNYIYCKHDGSLNNGFEIVTHPCSYAYHMNSFPWSMILREAICLGYLSHKAGTCGLHVHVSRLAFGSNNFVQEACIARLLYFFEKNWDELLIFSRRTPGQLQQWANRYGLLEHPKDILEHAKQGGYRNRYTCINLTNKDTIEFRLFRGTLKLNTLIATLQLVNRVCDVAMSFSDEEIKDLSWTAFVSTISEGELIQYLKERKIYINDTSIETEGN